MADTGRWHRGQALHSKVGAPMLPRMRFSPQAMKGLTPVLVLQVLGDGDRSGTEIIDRIRDLSQGHIEIPEGTIYPLLHRLEQQALVRGRWVVATGKRRRLYSATPAGVKTMVGERQAWSQLITALQLLWGPSKDTL